jgi:hypothetical protein
MASGALRSRAAGHALLSGMNTPSAGGRYPSDACGRTVLKCRRQLSITTGASDRELLSAWRARGQDRRLRRLLQPSAIPREHRQPDPGRRLLRTWSDYWANCTLR